MAAVLQVSGEDVVGEYFLVFLDWDEGNFSDYFVEDGEITSLCCLVLVDLDQSSAVFDGH